MNLTLSAVYICVTNKGRYGKGLTVKDAKKNAGLKAKIDEKHCEFYVMAAILDSPTDEEKKNILSCITSCSISGSPEYYEDNRTQEDADMITAKHVGWLTVEKNY